MAAPHNEDSFDDWLSKDPPTKNVAIAPAPLKPVASIVNDNPPPKPASVDTADEEYKRLFIAIKDVAARTTSGHDNQRKARVVAVVIPVSGTTSKSHADPPLLVAAAEEKARVVLGFSDNTFAVASGAVKRYIPNAARAGGLPMYKHGKLVAAIGISGDDPDVDEAIGKTALKMCGYSVDCNTPSKTNISDVTSCLVKAPYQNDARKKIVEAKNKRGVYFVYNRDKGKEARYVHCKHTFSELSPLVDWANTWTSKVDACPRCDAKNRYK